jgi:hypothetical protein
MNDATLHPGTEDEPPVPLSSRAGADKRHAPLQQPEQQSSEKTGDVYDVD